MVNRIRSIGLGRSQAGKYDFIMLICFFFIAVFFLPCSLIYIFFGCPHRYSHQLAVFFCLVLTALLSSLEFTLLLNS